MQMEIVKLTGVNCIKNVPFATPFANGTRYYQLLIKRDENAWFFIVNATPIVGLDALK